MTPEGRVKARVKRGLKTLPLEYEFWPVQTGLGAATLDCLMCYRGRFIAIETKSTGKKLTERQHITRDRIAAAGGLVYVVNGLDCSGPMEAWRWLNQIKSIIS